jgi:multidrug efflux pump subunit AcrB
VEFAGAVQTSLQDVRCKARVLAQFNIEQLRRVQGATVSTTAAGQLRLGDIATVTRGYSDSGVMLFTTGARGHWGVH